MGLKVGASVDGARVGECVGGRVGDSVGRNVGTLVGG